MNTHHHHDHEGHDHHHHDLSEGTSALITAFLLNLGFCIIEAFGGYFASSQAVMADALHDFGDSLSLLMLLGLRWLAQRPVLDGYSFGYRRMNILGAAIVGGSLVFGCILILGSSFPKLFNPHPVNSRLMLGLAVLGVTVNGLAFYKLRSQKGIGENFVSLHLLEDLWGWVIVFVGAIAIELFSWYWLDPLLSIFLAFFILRQSFIQLRSLGRLFLLGSSFEFSEAKVAALMRKIDGVEDVHHLHVWELDTGFHVVSAHVVLKQDAEAFGVKAQIREKLLEIGRCEVTLETEKIGEVCLDPVHSV